MSELEDYIFEPEGLEDYGNKMKRGIHKKKNCSNFHEIKCVFSLTEEEEKSERVEDYEELMDNLNLEGLNNMRKKRYKRKFDFLELEDNIKSKDVENHDIHQDWIDSEQDYNYDELLKRVFGIIREKNPHKVLDKRQKIIMRPPQMVRIGTKKTSFVNFTETCKTLHRQPKHLLDFLLAELGTSGSIDSTGQLIIKGRFLQKQMENVLRNYVKEYVTCHTCHSPETILQKDNRLYFLQCESCGSHCSVAVIKSGFVAVTGRRSALRAKIG